MTRKDPDAFRKRMRSAWQLNAYMLLKLPLALMAGLRLRELDETRCTVSVPHGWRSTNPFKSTYFAALSMAAELSTGAMVMAELEPLPQKTGMLVKGMEAQFGKRATDVVLFTCVDGERIRAAAEEAVRSGEAVVVQLASIGKMPDDTEVARFLFTWSIVAKNA